MITYPETHEERGQVMLVATLILSGVFAIGLAIALLLVTESRLARQSLDSVKAIYAAESGVECELYKDFQDSSYVCGPATVVMENNTSFLSQTVGGQATTTSAVGISNGVRRGLQIQIGQ